MLSDSSALMSLTTVFCFQCYRHSFSCIIIFVMQHWRNEMYYLLVLLLLLPLLPVDVGASADAERLFSTTVLFCVYFYWMGWCVSLMLSVEPCFCILFYWISSKTKKKTDHKMKYTAHIYLDDLTCRTPSFYYAENVCYVDTVPSSNDISSERY